MSATRKSKEEILTKMGVESLNTMQREAGIAIREKDEVVLLSPTGTGKTLAFLLPIIERIDADSEEIQVVILVPSRELAIQILHVIREMGSGLKANAVYGGRSGSKDKVELKHRPAILVGTPGRVADHLRRDTFSSAHITTLVLDEFDKSLEVGYALEMKEILDSLSGVKKKILTSATQGIEIPSFVRMHSPTVIDFLGEGVPELSIKIIHADGRDKMDSLRDMLAHIAVRPGIIFCNLKESIHQLSAHLAQNGIAHGTFHGDMEQMERERVLIKFRNGTYNLLLATDLAARGLDIPALKFILHYELPEREHEFTHRNGRTARMTAEGTAYVLLEKNEVHKGFVNGLPVEHLTQKKPMKESMWRTVYISGGRKDKISKGDIAGLFLKKGGLSKEELGLIELQRDCAFVSVPSHRLADVISKLDNERLKKRKVRVSEVE